MKKFVPLVMVLVAVVFMMTSVVSAAETETEPQAEPQAEVETTFDKEVSLALKVIRDERELAILRTMDFTEEEDAAFWPIYEAYRGDMEKVNERLVDLLLNFPADYEIVSDEEAEKMLSEFFTHEQEQLDVKKKYLKELEKVLPYYKITRFFQIENKLDSTTKFGLALQVPLIGGGRLE